MPKKLLCVDLGDVLVKFEDKFIRTLLREEKFESFLTLIHDHDRGILELFDLHKKLLLENYFKNPVSWKDLVRSYSDCISGIHVPMLEALDNLKKRGVKLACVTDNNHFCFYILSLKFPAICDLFHENGREQWLLSYKYTSLKRDHVSLFGKISTETGIPLKDAAFVDNLPINIEMARKFGFHTNACFLYDRFSTENHRRFLKFLDRHFPA